MTVLKKAGVGNSTYKGVCVPFVPTENMLPATMDPSAARSSTNGAPKQ